MCGAGLQIYPGIARRLLEGAAQRVEVRLQLAAQLLVEDSGGWPKGSRLECVAHHDNSVNNKYNPDPTKTVYWGDQTWEEMMIGWFDYTVDSQDLRKETALLK